MADNAAWHAAWTLGREGWPGLTLPEEAFVAFLQAKGLDPRADVRWADLYLACGCALADRAALAIFEAEVFPAIDLMAARERIPAPLLDEIRQDVREKLFVTREGAKGKIHDYSGTGDLRKWVRMVAVRVWLNKTRGKNAVTYEDRMLEGLLGTGDDPELEYMKRLYAQQFKRAFGEAFASLDPRSKNLIRYAFIDRLTLEQIGVVYGISRSSAARGVDKAHKTLADAVRASLVKHLGVSREEYESILRLIQSRLSVTLQTLSGQSVP